MNPNNPASPRHASNSPFGGFARRSRFGAKSILRSLTLPALLCLVPTVVHAQPTPDIVYEKLPPAPKWVDGYRLRYAIRLVGDPVKDPAKTALARIPTGGRLKPDASDVV